MALVYPVQNLHLQNGASRARTAEEIMAAKKSQSRRRRGPASGAAPGMTIYTDDLPEAQRTVLRDRTEVGSSQNLSQGQAGGDHWQRMLTTLQERLQDLTDRVVDVERAPGGGKLHYHESGAAVAATDTPEGRTLYSHMVELTNELASEKRRWRRAMKERDGQVAVLREEMVGMADGLKRKLLTTVGQQPARQQPAWQEEDRSVFGPEDFHEMKMLFKASSGEFESLKDGINSLRNVQLLLRQNEQQMSSYESRLESVHREFGDELAHLREKLLRADAQAAALRLTQVDPTDGSGVASGRSDQMKQVALTADTARIEAAVGQFEGRLKRLEAGKGESDDEGEWVEHSSPTGLSYFYNAKTKQSTWTEPKQSGGKWEGRVLAIEKSLADEKAVRHELEESLLREMKLRLSRVENRVDDFDVVATDGKTSVASQVTALQTELELLTRQVRLRAQKHSTAPHRTALPIQRSGSSTPVRYC